MLLKHVNRKSLEGSEDTIAVDTRKGRTEDTRGQRGGRGQGGGKDRADVGKGTLSQNNRGVDTNSSRPNTTPTPTPTPTTTTTTATTTTTTYYY